MRAVASINRADNRPAAAVKLARARVQEQSLGGKTVESVKNEATDFSSACSLLKAAVDKVREELAVEREQADNTTRKKASEPDAVEQLAELLKSAHQLVEQIKESQS